MLPELITIAHLYAQNDRTLEALVGDFTAADWAVTDAVGHDSRWLIGHLAATRLRLLGMVGLPPETTEWQGAFGRGTSPKDVSADLDPKALLHAFHEAHMALASHWDHITPEHLAKPLGRTLPDGTDTIGGAIRFLAWHEAYHLGQLGMMRRLVGKPGLA